MITVTDAAAAQIKTSNQQAGMEDMFLRISVRAKQDGALDYIMGFDAPAGNDMTVKDNGVSLLVAEDDEPMLSGATLDYVELVEGQHHFIFMNPNDANYAPPPKTKR